MKLVHTRNDIRIDFEENVTTVFVIENPEEFSRCVGDLWNQTNGLPGDWILSEGSTLYNLSKKAECITNPFAIDYNDRKIVTKVYKDLIEIANERYLNKLAVLNGEIISLLDEMVQETTYNLGSALQLDIQGLLKLYDVKFEIVDVTLLEKISTYVKILHRVLQIELFVFVGLKSFLSEKQLEELYCDLWYEKVHILLIESNHKMTLAGEHVIIMDNDLCIIDLQN